MKFLIPFALLLTTQLAFAEYCRDSDRGMKPEVAGKVVYSLGAENCLGETCYSQAIKEFDRCVDSQQVLEFACQQNKVTEKLLLCAAHQRCHQGACVKK